LIYEISLEDLLRAVESPLLRGNGASEGGNNLSFHVTVPLAGTELGVGTFVPEVRVSTHPRGEEEGRRDLFFIGASVGTSEGMNDVWSLSQTWFGGRKWIWNIRIINRTVHQEGTHETKFYTLEGFRKDVHPHLFGGAVLKVYVSSSVVVFDEEIFRFDVFSTLGTGDVSIFSQ
jgi:hypothetical protein